MAVFVEKLIVAVQDGVILCTLVITTYRDNQQK